MLSGSLIGMWFMRTGKLQTAILMRLKPPRTFSNGIRNWGRQAASSMRDSEICREDFWSPHDSGLIAKVGFGRIQCDNSAGLQPTSWPQRGELCQPRAFGMTKIFIWTWLDSSLLQKTFATQKPT